MEFRTIRKMVIKRRVRDAKANVVFCFKAADDAQVFAKRFGGERLAVNLRRWL